MPWNPELYHKFQSERFAPFDDLARIAGSREGMRVLDLGCGTGELTRRLADSLPGSRTVGIDSSPEMLAKAAPLARPGLEFRRGRIEDAGGDGEWDLVFTHAALQWVDDHTWLIPRLVRLLAPGGRLAVQMPSNHAHPSHSLIREIALEEPFHNALGGWVRMSPVLKIDEYADLLFQCGGSDMVVFEKVYPHVLENVDALADWTSGTALVPYMDRLGEELGRAFMERYRARLRELFPESPLFYGFRRTLFAMTASA